MKYIALLRGINVGGNNKVPMQKLRECFEAQGFTNVATYINSGNVIFNTKLKSERSMVRRIEEGIEQVFGFPVRVVVRSEANVKKVAKSIPSDWENNKNQKSDVLFLWEAYDDKNSLDLIDAVKGVDEVKYVDGAMLWNVDRNHYNQSAMSKLVGTELYKNMTARNVNTVRKIAELLC